MCKCPEVIEEWDYDKNTTTPDKVSYRSGRKAWWKCKECSQSWEAVVSGRTDKRKSKCPYCSNTKVGKVNNLKVKYPEIAKEWSDRNKKTKAEEVLPCSGVKYWWVCKVCNSEWKTSPHNRVSHNSGCPFCYRAISKISQCWLDFLGIKIKELRIKELNFIVDGFDSTTNTVYEFLGDYWHGNPKIFSSEEVNPTNKKTYGVLYKEWLDRKALLEKAGYKVVYIWESDFERSKEYLSLKVRG
jgi:hypothetical protein